VPRLDEWRMHTQPAQWAAHIHTRAASRVETYPGSEPDPLKLGLIVSVLEGELDAHHVRTEGGQALRDLR
jgi:hypothetical protein